MAISSKILISVDLNELMIHRKVAARCAAREWKLMRAARNAGDWSAANRHHLFYALHSARARAFREVMRM